MQTGPRVFVFFLGALVDLSTRGFSSTISGLDHCTCSSYLVLGFVRLFNCTMSPQDESQSISSDQVLRFANHQNTRRKRKKEKEKKRKKEEEKKQADSQFSAQHESVANTAQPKQPIICTSHYLRLQRYFRIDST